MEGDCRVLCRSPCQQLLYSARRHVRAGNPWACEVGGSVHSERERIECRASNRSRTRRDRRDASHHQLEHVRRVLLTCDVCRAGFDPSMAVHPVSV